MGGSTGLELADCLKLDMQDIGIAEAFLAKTGLYTGWTKDGERLREITRVCESSRALGGLAEAEYAGISGFCWVGVAMLVQVCSYERSLELYERKQAYEGVHERSRI